VANKSSKSKPSIRLPRDEDNGGVVAAGGAEPTRALFEALSPRGQKRRLREGHDAGGISKIPTLNGTARRSV
jgi:hypothetical protein